MNGKDIDKNGQSKRYWFVLLLTIRMKFRLLGLGQNFLFDSKCFQIGNGVGNFSEINSENLRDGNFLDPELSVKGRGKG